MVNSLFEAIDEIKNNVALWKDNIELRKGIIDEIEIENYQEQQVSSYQVLYSLFKNQTSSYFDM